MSLPILDMKPVAAIDPGPILDNASATGIAIDTRGAGYLFIAVRIGATDVAATELKLTESDTSGGTYTDVANSAFGTALSPSGDVSVLPAADDDNQTFGFSVDVRNLTKPFVKVAFTAGNGSTGTYVFALGWLSRLDRAPRNAADLGLTADTNWIDI